MMYNMYNMFPCNNMMYIFRCVATDLKLEKKIYHLKSNNISRIVSYALLITITVLFMCAKYILTNEYYL